MAFLECSALATDNAARDKTILRRRGTATTKYLVDITERRTRRVKGLTPAIAVSLLSISPLGSALPFVEQRCGCGMMSSQVNAT
jgi:hypothetical protein